jgi:hypothetical protein
VAALDHDLLLEAGVTYAQPFRYQHADGSSATSAGWSAKWQIRASIDSPTVLLEGTPTITQSTGEVIVALSASDTRALPKAAVWGLEFYGPSSATEVRIAQGKVRVSPEVVRP